MKRTTIWVWGLMAVASQWARGDVLEVREAAFVVETRMTVPGSAKAVYAEFAHPDRWWDSEHTWSGSAKNLSMELRAGGCFCEKLADGGSVQHGRVIYLQPNVMVRLDAALGPLQDMAINGVLTFKFAPGEKSGETLVTLTYRVAGAMTLESAKLAPIVDQVMSGQLQRLRDHVGKLPR